MIDINKRGEFDLLELNSNKIYKQTSKILPTKLLLVNRSKDEVILQVDINKNIPKDTLSYSDFVTNFTNVLDDSKLFNFDVILKTSDIQDDLSVLLFGYHDIDNAGSKYIVPRDCCLGSAKIKEFLCGKSLRNPSNVFRLSIFIIDGVVKAKIALLDSMCSCADTGNVNLKVHNIAPVQHNYETNIIQTIPDLHNYVTKDSLTHFVNELIKDKLDKSVLIDFVNIDILKDELKSYYDKNEIDSILKSFKVDLSDYYNKNEIDNKLSNIKVPKINLNDYYNKNEVDDIIENALKNAVDLSDYYKKKDTYNKYEIDNKIANIKPKEIDLSNYYNKNETYDKNSVYNKSEINDKLSDKADKTDLDLKANKSDLNAKADKNSVYEKSEVYNKFEIDSKFDSIPKPKEIDLSDYYNKNETYNKDEIANLLSDVQTGDVDLSDYYKKDAVYNKFEIDAKLSESSAGGGSLDNYYTKKETNKLFDDLLETRIPYDIIQALREGYESENIEVDLGEFDDILWAGSEVAAVKFDQNVIHVKSPLYNVDIPHEFNILSYSLVPMGNGLLGVFVQTSEKNVAGWVADVITGNLTKTYEESDIFDVKIMKRHDLRYSNDISNESIFELSKRGIHKDRNILIPFILKESKGISFVSNNVEKLSILTNPLKQPGIIMEVVNIKKGDYVFMGRSNCTYKIDHDYIIKKVDKIHGCFLDGDGIVLGFECDGTNFMAHIEEDVYEIMTPGEICIRQIKQLNKFTPSLTTYTTIPKPLNGVTKRKHVSFFVVGDELLYKIDGKDSFEKIPSKLIYNVSDINFNPVLKIISKKENKVYFKNIQRIYDFVKEFTNDREIKLPDIINVENIQYGDVIELELDTSKSGITPKIPKDGSISLRAPDLIEAAGKDGKFKTMLYRSIIHPFTDPPHYKTIDNDPMNNYYNSFRGEKRIHRRGFNVISQCSSNDMVYIEDSTNKVKLKIIFLENNYYILILVRDNIENNMSYPVDAIMGKIDFEGGLKITTKTSIYTVSYSHLPISWQFRNEVSVTSFKRYKLNRFDERIFTVDNILFKPLNISHNFHWNNILEPAKYTDDILISEESLKSPILTKNIIKKRMADVTSVNPGDTFIKEDVEYYYGWVYKPQRIIDYVTNIKTFLENVGQANVFKYGNILNDWWMFKILKSAVTYDQDYFNVLSKIFLGKEYGNVISSAHDLVYRNDINIMNINWRRAVLDNLSALLSGVDYLAALEISTFNKSCHVLEGDVEDDGTLSFLMVTRNECGKNIYSNVAYLSKYEDGPHQPRKSRRGVEGYDIPVILYSLAECASKGSNLNKSLDVDDCIFERQSWDPNPSSQFHVYGNKNVVEICKRILECKEDIIQNIQEKYLVNSGRIKRRIFNNINVGLDRTAISYLENLASPYGNMRKYFRVKQVIRNDLEYKKKFNDVKDKLKTLVGPLKDIKILGGVPSLLRRSDLADSIFCHIRDRWTDGQIVAPEDFLKLKLNGLISWDVSFDDIESYIKKSIEYWISKDANKWLFSFNDIVRWCEYNTNDIWSDGPDNSFKASEYYGSVEYSQKFITDITYKIKEYVANKYNKKDVFHVLIPGVTKHINYYINNSDQNTAHNWLDCIVLHDNPRRKVIIGEALDNAVLHMTYAMDTYGPVVDDEYRKLMETLRVKLSKIKNIKDLEEFIIEDAYNYITAYNKNSYYNKIKYKSWPPIIVLGKYEQKNIKLQDMELGGYYHYQSYLDDYGVGGRIIEKIKHIIFNEDIGEYFEVALYTEEWKEKYAKYNSNFFDSDYNKKYSNVYIPKLLPFDRFSHSLNNVFEYIAAIDENSPDFDHKAYEASVIFGEYLNIIDIENAEELISSIIISGLIENLRSLNA